MTSEFIEQYLDLLLFQYRQQTNAEAEIDLMASQGEKLYDLLSSYREEYDIDTAVGAQLDVLGRILQFPRQVPHVLDKIRFGFDNNDNSRGFADRFDPNRESAPFSDRFERKYTDLQLDDETYRRFLKVKVAKNTGSATIVDDERISLQDAVEIAFGMGNAYVQDNKDMSLTIYIAPEVEEQRALTIKRAGLLPRPQGVGYSFIIQANPAATFGFDVNPNAKGFADRFDSTRESGVLARRLIDA